MYFRIQLITNNLLNYSAKYEELNSHPKLLAANAGNLYLHKVQIDVTSGTDSQS